MNTTDSIFAIGLAVFFAGWLIFALAFGRWIQLYHEDKRLRDR